MNRSAVRPGRFLIAARQPGAADVELADNADGDRPEPLVQDIEARVGDRTPDRNRERRPASTRQADDQTVVSVGP